MLIDFLKNATAEKAEYEPLPRKEHYTSGRLAQLVKKSMFRFEAPRVDDNDIDILLDMIRASEKPLIICGGGVVRSRSQEQLTAFAEKLDAPVALTVMGAGGMNGRNPLTTGMIGMHGSQASNMACDGCDLLIAIG